MNPDLVPYRLRPQRLVGPPEADAVAAVARLGAVQAQLPDMALWGIGRRCGSTLAEVRARLDDGSLLRTHVLRPTWHVVTPDLLRLLLDVTTPRVERLWSSTLRSQGLDELRVLAASAVALDALRSTSQPLTRTEVGDRLSSAGHDAGSSALAHVMMWLELQGLVASGPWRGKQQTYAPITLPTSTLAADEQLAEVARRYARGHGPVTARDLSWWTSLTLTQARRAIDLADLTPVVVAGQELFALDEATPADVPPVLLLPTFDELTSYVRAPADYASSTTPPELVMRSAGLLFVDGALSGTWSRTVRTQHVDIEVTTDAALDPTHRSALESEADAFGRFLGLQPRLSVGS